MTLALLADLVLVAGTLILGAYCFVLSRRLARFADLERGVGGAIASLSAQVDSMQTALRMAEATASASTTSLEGVTEKADGVARRLELLVASMHDIDSAGTRPVAKPEAHLFQSARREGGG